MKKFFEKYVSVAKIIKVWNYSIKKSEVDEIFDKLDLDDSNSLQLKDLFLAIVKKAMK